MDILTCTNCGANNITNAKYCSKCGHTLPQNTTETKLESVQPPTTEKKGKKFLGMVVGIIAFGLSYWGVQQIFFKPPSFDKVMMNAASELNKTCPIMVDQNTRLDNAVALPDKALQYNYTLVDIEKLDVNPDTIKKYIEPNIINNIKTSPDLKIYRDNKATMIYNYRDKNGVFVLKLSITPDMYE